AGPGGGDGGARPGFGVPAGPVGRVGRDDAGAAQRPGAAGVPVGGDGRRPGGGRRAPTGLRPLLRGRRRGQHKRQRRTRRTGRRRCKWLPSSGRGGSDGGRISAFRTFSVPATPSASRCPTSVLPRFTARAGRRDRCM
ncbi:MAG: hypothetical protein AVDCRST_MAG49-63, partial [uncultured Thermomicrobiales bacterium]